MRARGPYVLPSQRCGLAGRAGVLDCLGRGGVAGRPDDLTQPLGVDGGRSPGPRVGQGAVQPGKPHADLVGLLGGRELAPAGGVHPVGQRDPRLELGGPGGIRVADLVHHLVRVRGRAVAAAVGEHVPKACAGIGRGLDRDLAGDQSRLAREGCQPLAVMRDPLVDLSLIGQRRPVRLGFEHNGQVTHVGMAQDRERPAVRIPGLRELRGGEQTGELVGPTGDQSQRSGAVAVLTLDPGARPAGPGAQPLQPCVAVVRRAQQHEQRRDGEGEEHEPGH